MTATYVEPGTVAEALDALAELDESARVVAGGTDLVVGARQGKSPLPEALVAIHRLEELRGIENGAGIRLGALVTHGEIESSELLRERYSALADAAALVGSPATRHVGTLGGNIANASPAMEAGSPLLVLGATVEVTSREGTRTLALTELLRGPGETALAPGELITGVTVPEPPAGAGSAYVRLEYRQAMEIAVVGAAALVQLDGDGRCAEIRVALTAVAPTCVPAPVDASLRGKALTFETLTEAAAGAAGACAPIDDVRAPADYRRAMVPVIVRRALERALERAKR